MRRKMVIAYCLVVAVFMALLFHSHLNADIYEYQASPAFTDYMYQPAIYRHVEVITGHCDG